MTLAEELGTSQSAPKRKRWQAGLTPPPDRAGHLYRIWQACCHECGSRIHLGDRTEGDAHQILHHRGWRQEEDEKDIPRWLCSRHSSADYDWTEHLNTK